MRTQNAPFRLIAAAAVTGLLAGPALPLPVLAQPAPPPLANPADQQTGDPPDRVGRLARLDGAVSFHGPDDTQWNTASLNYPVTQGEAFWTQPNSQAEIEVSASRVAMAPGTELDVASLTDNAFQATLPQGEVYLRIQAAAPDETYAVQTPRGLVMLASPGRYEIAAGDTQTPTLVTVMQGSAHVSGPGVELDVGANQTAAITGDDTFAGNVGPAQPDAFLNAMLAREQPPRPQGVAPPAVVASMPGGEDLSAYGSWSQAQDYGEVWYPQVAQDWVPYQEGSWAYVAPWGWTWVDSAPWGFAPFHYGRWAHIGGRWGWVPGGPVGRPIYAPALVTFIGVGAAVGIGAALAAGRVGWVPLGPREPFHPWYHASDRYFQNVNRAHVSNVTTINRNVTMNNFANRSAMTVVPASAMTGSRPIRPVAQRVEPAQLAQARPVIGAQPLRPAASTMGVTPVVARQLSLAPAPGRAPAPGPAIHATPAFAGAAAAHPVTPLLHNPNQPAAPVAAGIRPLTAPPALHAPVPGNAGPPAIHHEPMATAPGAAVPSLAPHTATPAVVTHQPPPTTGVPPALHAPSVANTPQPQAAPQFHAPPPVTATHTLPPQPAQAAPQFHAPPPVTATHTLPPQPAQAAPQFHAPPPVTATHTLPPQPAQAAPQFHAPPPVAAVHTPPPQPAPQFHAPPPVAAVHTPPPQPAPQFHAPPPVAAVHAPPPPAAVHAPPPPPAPHPAPAPQAQNSAHKKPGEP